MKTETGPVRTRLEAAGADAGAMAAWREIVAEDIRAEDDADEFQ